MGPAARVSGRSWCAAAAHLSLLSMLVLPFLRPANVVCIGTRGGIINNQVLLHRLQIETGGASEGITRRCFVRFTWVCADASGSSSSPSPSDRQ